MNWRHRWGTIRVPRASLGELEGAGVPEVLSAGLVRLGELVVAARAWVLWVILDSAPYTQV